MSDATRNHTLAHHPVYPNALGMPLDFGDAAREYAAAREKAVVFDLSQRTQLAVSGADRVKFLNNFCTNDLMKLTEGSGCEAYLTNVKGRVLADLFVAVAKHQLMIDAEPLAAETILPHLERYIITEDVTLIEEIAAAAKLFVTGPQAAALLAISLDATAIEQLETYQHCQVPFVQMDISFWRVDWFQTSGYLITADQQSITCILKQCLTAGVRQAGFSAYEALRISSGWPCFGCDFSDDNLPQEVFGHQHAVSFTKGCYLGQEPIARLDAMGHTNKQLALLQLMTFDCFSLDPTSGFAIETAEQQVIGQITSIACIPGDTTAYAFGFVKRGYEKVGTQLIVRSSLTEESQKVNTVTFEAVVSAS